MSPTPPHIRPRPPIVHERRDVGALAPLPEGTQVGNFIIAGTVGGDARPSATGFTYRAVEDRRGQRAILKEFAPPTLVTRAGDGDDELMIVPLPGEPEATFTAALASFRSQARAFERIRHPGLMRVLGLHDAYGTAYLAAEEVAGETLAAIVAAGGSPSERRLCGWLRSLCGGLAAVHQAGLVHADVTPGNVVIGADDRLVLIDVGTGIPAAGAHEERSRWLTHGFAAIELYLAGGKEGPWTDVYGVAATAYWLMTGTVPADARARVYGRPLAWTGEWSVALRRAIDAGMAVEPTARPASAAALAAMLPDPATAANATAARQPAPQPQAADLPRTVRIARCAKPPAPPDARAAEALPGAAPAVADPERRRRMRRLVAAGIAAVALAAAAWPIAAQLRSWLKRDWIVDAGGRGDTTSLAEAVARAVTGARIVVMPGTYSGPIVLDRELHLVGGGERPEDVVIATARGSCLRSSSPSASVAKLTLRNQDSPDPAPCIDVTAGALRLDGVVVRGAAGPALRIAHTANPSVRASKIIGASGHGIVVESGGRGTVEGTEISTAGKSGIVVRTGGDPTVLDCTVRDAGTAGILVTAGGKGRFEGVVIERSGFSGVEVRGGGDPMVFGNRIEQGREAGIFVHEGGRGTFSENRVQGNGMSAAVIGAGGDPILSSNLLFENKEHGVLLLDNARGRVESNRIEGNEGLGLAIATGAQTLLGENVIAGNRDPQSQTGRYTGP